MDTDELTNDPTMDMIGKLPLTVAIAMTLLAKRRLADSPTIVTPDDLQDMMDLLVGEAVRTTRKGGFINNWLERIVLDYAGEVARTATEMRRRNIELVGHIKTGGKDG